MPFLNALCCDSAMDYVLTNAKKRIITALKMLTVARQKSPNPLKKSPKKKSKETSKSKANEAVYGSLANQQYRSKLAALSLYR